MVPRQDLRRLSTGMVKQDEVLQQVHEVMLLADAEQHGLQIDCADFIFFQTLPLVEEIKLGAHRADLCLQSVGEHQEGVEMEELRDGIQVVGVVAVVGVLNVNGVLFELDKQQRKAIDKAHNIRAAAVMRTVDLHFLDGEEVVFLRLVKVEDCCLADICRSVVLLDMDGNPVFEQVVFFLVDLHEG